MSETAIDIIFDRLFSAEFSLPTGKPYTFLNTNGAWAGECLRTQTVLDGGELVFESRRGPHGISKRDFRLC